MKELAKKRRQAGMSQRELAEKLMVVTNTVTQWEMGVRKPNIVMLKKLAQLLDCSTDDLLADIEV